MHEERKRVEDGTKDGPQELLAELHASRADLARAKEYAAVRATRLAPPAAPSHARPHCRPLCTPPEPFRSTDDPLARSQRLEARLEAEQSARLRAERDLESLVRDMEWSDLRRRLKTIFAGEAEARAGGSASAGGLLQFRRRESPRDSNNSDYSSDALSEDGQCSGQCSPRVEEARGGLLQAAASWWSEC